MARSAGIRSVRTTCFGSAVLWAALALATPARAAEPAADRAAVAAAPGPATTDTSAREEPRGASARIDLTWHAPYGQRRATDQLTAACGDTTRTDTLYMCLDPGKGADQLVGLTATVYFWAASGETLGTHWSFGDGQNFKRLKVQFNPDSVPGAGPLCPGAPVARASYTRTPASGKLMLIVAVPESQPQPVRGGTIYTLARLLVPRPAFQYPGCDRGICIEWALCSIAYDATDEPQVNRGQRFVTWNSPNGKACAPLRAFAAPLPWKPPPTQQRH